MTAVLFLAAISGYDQGLIEDRDSVSAASWDFRRNSAKGLHLGPMTCALAESNARGLDALRLDMQLNVVRTDLDDPVSGRLNGTRRARSSLLPVAACLRLVPDALPTSPQQLPQQNRRLQREDPP